MHKISETCEGNWETGNDEMRITVDVLEFLAA